MKKSSNRSTRIQTERNSWFDEQKEQFRQDEQHRHKETQVRQLIQTAVSLHAAVLIGMLLAGIIIVIRVMTGHADIADPDAQNYKDYAIVYVGIFVISALAYLTYAQTNKQTREHE